jgi:HK97 family phage major capsid protein
MKRIIAKASLAALASLTLLFALNVISAGVLLAGIVATQLTAFMAAAPQGALFNGVLTPEQVKEFESTIAGLKEYKDLFPSLKDIPGQIRSHAELIGGIRSDLDSYRKLMLMQRLSRPARPGEVSEDCARFLGGIALLGGLKSGVIRGDRYEGIARDALGGIEIKTALSSSDIPLPDAYSGDVVELVSQYGTARRYGTVFPLGANPVKLPYLSTDTTFTVLPIATAITEKSPAITFVTFTPEKFGGLIRLPTEIDEDSIVPMGQFLARYAARNMARAEDYNFWCSTGTVGTVNGDVEGLTISTITNSKVTQMASTKTHYSDLTLAHLRAVRAVPDAAAMRNGAYYMHPSFEQALATLNTAGDKPYNPQAQIMGTGAQPFTTGPTLDGFPIRWVDVMPAYSSSVNASKVCVLFGDASFQYLGIRRGFQFETSREAAFANDEILIRATERFTIGLMALGSMAGIETKDS